MPTDVRTAFALVSQRLGIKDKEPSFGVNISRLIQPKRPVVLRHDCFIKGVRLIQPLRVRLIQITSNYISFGHWRTIVCLDATGLSQARVF